MRKSYDKLHPLQNNTKKNYYTIQNLDIPVCPYCHSILTVRDSRKRSVKDACGNSYTFSLKRLKCPECNTLHIELPDFMLPHKHYSQGTIETVISGNYAICAADNRTMQRWIKGK